MKLRTKISKTLRKKSVIFLILLALIIAGIVLLLHNLNKPAVGVINQTVDNNQPNAPVVLKDFRNKYFITKYSSRYDLQDNKNPSASLQSWVLIAKQSFGGNISAKIAVSIEKLPLGGVKESSDYKLFASQPKIYTISRPTYNYDVVVVGYRTEGNFEKTALWAHGNYLLTASMTAGSKTDQLLTEMDIILTSLTWADQQ